MRVLPLVFIFALGLSSCRKDFVPKPATVPAATSTKDLKVAADFDWATTRSMEVEMTAASKGLMLIQDEKANVIYKGLVNANETHSIKITFPSTLKKAYIFFNGVNEEIALGSKKFVSKLN